MPIDIDRGMLDYMRESSGNTEVELRHADALVAVRGLEEARMEIFRIRNPEQPDQSYASFASEVHIGRNGPRFWFDMSDSEIYDGLLEGVLYTIVSAVEAAGVDDGLITWPQSFAQQRMSPSAVEELSAKYASFLAKEEDQGLVPEYLDGALTAPPSAGPAPKGWSSRAPMPTPRYKLAGTTGPDGRIYAIGGYRGNRSVKTVEVYDPVSDRWSKVAPMRVARRGPGVALGQDGRIYAIGGFGYETSIRGMTTAEAYDPAADRWELVAPMTALALNEMAAITGMDGRIFAVAIGVGRNILEAYDTTSDRWTPLAPPPGSYEEIHAVAAADGWIYTLGAEQGEVEAYDPRSKRWRTVSPRRHRQRSFGAAVGGDGRIYVMGGMYYRDGRPVATVEAYRTEDDTWVDAEPMPSPRKAMALASGLGGEIYAFGGDVLDEASRSGSVDAVTTDVYVP